MNSPRLNMGPRLSGSMPKLPLSPKLSDPSGLRLSSMSPKMNLKKYHISDKLQTFSTQVRVDASLACAAVKLWASKSALINTFPFFFKTNKLRKLSQTYIF